MSKKSVQSVEETFSGEVGGREPGGERPSSIAPPVANPPLGPTMISAEHEDRSVEFEIHRVCDEINLMGEKPTYKLIRAMRGSGSFSTIEKYLKTWIPADAIVSPSPIPSELERLFNTTLAAVWSEASKAGRAEASLQAQRFAELEAQLRQGIEDLERDYAAAEARAAQAQDDNRSLESRRTDLEKMIAELRIEIGRLEGEIRGLQRRPSADFTAGLDALYKET